VSGRHAAEHARLARRHLQPLLDHRRVAARAQAEGDVEGIRHAQVNEKCDRGCIGLSAHAAQRGRLSGGQDGVVPAQGELAAGPVILRQWWTPDVAGGAVLQRGQAEADVVAPG
jgi:hypothetical protein